MIAGRFVIARLSLMMFLQFFVWGSFFVTMGVFLLARFQGEAGINILIGQAYATHNWAALLAPLFVGLLADRYFRAERLNAFCQIAGGLLLWYAAQVHDPGTFVWIMLAYFLLYMPTLALVNAITFASIASPARQFPAVRVWGTVGWIVAGFVVAQSILGQVDLPLLKRFTGVDNAQVTDVPLKLAAVVSLAYGLYSLTLPATPPQARGIPFSVGHAFGFDALRLMAERNFAVFALCRSPSTTHAPTTSSPPWHSASNPRHSWRSARSAKCCLCCSCRSFSFASA
jgi:MFS family permease